MAPVVDEWNIKIREKGDTHRRYIKGIQETSAITSKDGPGHLRMEDQSQNNEVLN